jgi:hypothetical protein
VCTTIATIDDTGTSLGFIVPSDVVPATAELPVE